MCGGGGVIRGHFIFFQNLLSFFWCKLDQLGGCNEVAVQIYIYFFFIIKLISKVMKLCRTVQVLFKVIYKFYFAKMVIVRIKSGEVCGCTLFDKELIRSCI